MARSKFTRSQILKAAKDKCGFDDLRPGQEEAIRSILEGHDTLAVQPTGSGKSAIYQIAGALLHGATVVVSPLIALQKDQVDSIEEQDVGDAAAVNSTARVSEVRDAFEKLASGDLNFLFLAPEQFRNPETLERIREAGPKLFVVDEAHCISEWGHDFRPDYMRLAAAVEELGHPTVLAMTATAAPRVREEIIEKLGMQKPRVIVKGFDRPNIRLEVQPVPTEAAKRDALFDAVENGERPAIVYAATRKHTEELSNELGERGINVLHYHGGMPAKERERVQDEFMAGNADVIVATSAFGMGVDKPDVRAVYHFDVPDSLDTYYQEAGRAGRDGKPARALLLYRPEDFALQRFFKGGGKVREEELKQVAEMVRDEERPVETETLQEETDLSARKIEKAINRLEEAGAVERLANGEIAAGDSADKLEEAVEEAARAQDERSTYEHLRMEKMRAYAELNGCRREYLLEYFGEEASSHCGNCDWCLRAPQEQVEAKPVQRERKTRKPRAAKAAGSECPDYPLKSRVTHKEWGKGVVEGCEAGKITVLFDEADVGRKTLSLDAVRSAKLLEPAA